MRVSCIEYYPLIYNNELIYIVFLSYEQINKYVCLIKSNNLIIICIY